MFAPHPIRIDAGRQLSEMTMTEEDWRAGVCSMLLVDVPPGRLYKSGFIMDDLGQVFILPATADGFEEGDHIGEASSLGLD